MLLLLLLLSHFSCVRLCVTPRTAAHQAPLSLGFSRQEHWSGLPFCSPTRESEVTQSCLTLSDPMDCSLPGFSVHGIFQARVLEWGAIAFSSIMSQQRGKVTGFCRNTSDRLLFSHHVVSDSATPWTAASQDSLPFTISQSVLKLMSIESVMPSNYLILCCPLLSIFPSIRIFSNESALGIRWPKDWSFSFSISPFSPSEWTGWISLQSKGLSRVFSSTTVQKHQFFGTRPSLWSSSHIHT